MWNCDSFVLLQEECDGDELVLQLDDGFQRLLAHGDSPAWRLTKEIVYAYLHNFNFALSALCHRCVMLLPSSSHRRLL